MSESLEQLSEALRIAAIALDEMRAARPDFDAIPFAEATRRNCVALRADDGMLLVVLGNPYDLDTQDWIEERLREPFGYRVAQRADVAAYLSQQETQLRRVASAKAIASKSGRSAPISASVMAAMRSVSESCSRLSLI